MKLKVNWKELMKQLWTAIKPVLLGAIGGGIVGVASGCSSMTPSDKTQTMGVYAFGIPGIAVITQSHQTADFSASDTLVTVDTASIVSEMRSWCVEGGSDLDTEAGATVKLPLADGTELTRSVAIGE